MSPHFTTLKTAGFLMESGESAERLCSQTSAVNQMGTLLLFWLLVVVSEDGSWVDGARTHIADRMWLHEAQTTSECGLSNRS